jgi:hypothetical protein
LFISLFSSSHAIAGEARTNLPVPSGTTLLNIYYIHSYGNEYYRDNDKISDASDLSMNMCILHPIYYTSIGSLDLNLHALIPFGEAELNGEHSTGVGDITLFSQLWLINSKEKKFFFVYAPYFTVPSGRYSRDSIVNIGDNRWSTKQEVAIVKGFGEKTWLELLANGRFFSDNDDVSGSGNRTVTSGKDPVFGIEMHLSYDFTPSFYGSLDYFFTHGGEHTIDGILQYDRTSSHVLGPSFVFSINRQANVMCACEFPLAVENGVKTSSAWLRLAYSF